MVGWLVGGGQNEGRVCQRCTEGLDPLGHSHTPKTFFFDPVDVWCASHHRTRLLIGWVAVAPFLPEHHGPGRDSNSIANTIYILPMDCEGP